MAHPHEIFRAYQYPSGGVGGVGLFWTGQWGFSIQDCRHIMSYVISHCALLLGHSVVRNEK